MSPPSCLALTLLLMLIPCLVLHPASSAEAAGSGYYGDSSSLPFANNMCYHQRTGQAKFCQPQFENLAVNQAVAASTTCGSPPVRICRQDESGRHCEICDASQPKRSHPASHLTDYHVHGSCWVSGPLSAAAPSVNLTLSLRKKHTVYYMSITGCGTDVPDAMEAYKSSDYGATWQLWHLFSKNCSRDYNRRGYSYQFRETIQPKEVICSDINLITNINDISGNQLQQPVLSFSTNFNRYSTNGNYEKDPVIIDWMLATDLRLVLRRHALPNGSFPSQPFAFSNLDVGGRCFCNGHASRCVPRGDHTVCECAHGTEGDDCERCKPLWVDLPWRRGTLSRPTECRPCNCNLHSEQCSFDQDLYTTSGSVSGGRCARCQHNTHGASCEKCSPGYYRDTNKDMTSPKACKVCNCHPLGSVTNACDRTTGKCACNEGVDGDKCDRCRSGYEQTNDVRTPCRKIGTVLYPPPPPPPLPPRPPPRPPRPQSPRSPPSATGGGLTSVDIPSSRPGDRSDPDDVGRDGEGGGDGDNAGGGKKCPAKCRSTDQRLTQEDFCLRGWALVVQIQRVRRQRRWVQVTAEVRHVYRCPKGCPHLPPSVTLWVKRRQWKCRCPKLRPSLAYLLMTRDKRHRRHKEDLVIDKQSIAWEWKPDLEKKMGRFKGFSSHNRDAGGSVIRGAMAAAAAPGDCGDCDCVMKERKLRKQRRRERQIRKQRERRQRRMRQQRQRRQRSSSGSG